MFKLGRCLLGKGDDCDVQGARSNFFFFFFFLIRKADHP